MQGEQSLTNKDRSRYKNGPVFCTFYMLLVIVKILRFFFLKLFFFFFFLFSCNVSFFYLVFSFAQSSSGGGDNLYFGAQDVPAFAGQHRARRCPLRGASAWRPPERAKRPRRDGRKAKRSKGRAREQEAAVLPVWPDARPINNRLRGGPICLNVRMLLLMKPCMGEEDPLVQADATHQAS